MLPSNYHTIPEQTARLSRRAQRFQVPVSPHRVWRRVLALGLGVQLGRQWFVPDEAEDRLAQDMGLLPRQAEG